MKVFKNLHQTVIDSCVISPLIACCALYGLKVRLVHRKIGSCQCFRKVSLHNIVCMYQTIIILIVLVICTQRFLCVKPASFAKHGGV